jgi:hypothetical protein
VGRTTLRAAVALSALPCALTWEEDRPTALSASSSSSLKLGELRGWDGGSEAKKWGK